jgi:hypothetical protein
MFDNPSNSKFRKMLTSYYWSSIKAKQTIRKTRFLIQQFAEKAKEKNLAHQS